MLRQNLIVLINLSIIGPGTEGTVSDAFCSFCYEEGWCRPSSPPSVCTVKGQHLDLKVATYYINTVLVLNSVLWH